MANSWIFVQRTFLKNFTKQMLKTTAQEVARENQGGLLSQTLVFYKCGTFHRAQMFAHSAAVVQLEETLLEEEEENPGWWLTGTKRNSLPSPMDFSSRKEDQGSMTGHQTLSHRLSRYILTKQCWHIAEGITELQKAQKPGAWGWLKKLRIRGEQYYY